MDFSGFEGNVSRVDVDRGRAEGQTSYIDPDSSVEGTIRTDRDLRVEGSVSGHGADLLNGRDLVQQVRQNGLSPLSLEVNSTARMSPVAVSIARWTLRYWRRRCAPCLRTSHSPSPRNLIPVLSTSRFRGSGHGGSISAP